MIRGLAAPLLFIFVDAVAVSAYNACVEVGALGRAPTFAPSDCF